jgi:hypothetical protein
MPHSCAKADINKKRLFVGIAIHSYYNLTILTHGSLTTIVHLTSGRDKKLFFQKNNEINLRFINLYFSLVLKLSC